MTDLGGDTSYIETGAAQLAPAFNTSHFEAQLSSLYSCYIASRPSSHDHQILRAQSRTYIQRIICNLSIDL